VTDTPDGGARSIHGNVPPGEYISGMDLYLAAGIAMLLAWGGLTLATDAPGVVHLLLTAGVFVIIWRIVVRDTPSGPRSGKP